MKVRTPRTLPARASRPEPAGGPSPQARFSRSTSSSAGARCSARGGADLDSVMELVFGAGQNDRRIAGVEHLLREWREKEADWGQLYLEYEPVTPRDRLVVEDLAVTMLMNSLVSARAAASVSRHGATPDLASLPDKALEETTGEERRVVAEFVGAMANWPWLGASTATKTLHKKRPALIPVLDNMAIFGAYMNPLWPQGPALADTVKAVSRIREALDWIAADLTRSENEPVWERLHELEPEVPGSSCSTWSGGCTSRRVGAATFRLDNRPSVVHQGPFGTVLPCPGYSSERIKVSSCISVARCTSPKTNSRLFSRTTPSSCSARPRSRRVRRSTCSSRERPAFPKLRAARTAGS